MAGRGWRYAVALLVVVLGALQLSPLPAGAAVSQAEVTALQLLSQTWNAGSLLGWTGDDVCSWTPYVTCQNNAVTGLSITSNQQIQGLIPAAAIAGLTNLLTLEISIIPGLSGLLPDELGTLTSLTYLNLQLCNFTGNIPTSLGQLKNLKFLALNDNQLSGSIPSELGALSQVFWFDVSSNLLIGELPTSSSSPNGVGLDNLTNAAHLHLNNNTLTGSIPPELCSLPKLVHLLLDSNSLGGNVPVEIGNFPQLVILRLQHNNFIGPIPPSISKLSTLAELHLNGNAFTGTLPDFSVLQNLQLLDVSENKFSNQPFPSFIQSLRKLQTLAASDASFIGGLPTFVFGISTLESLTLSNNSLNGTLNFGTVGPALVVVFLDNNNFDSIASPGPQNQFQDISLESNPLCSNGQSASIPVAWCSPPSEKPYLKTTNCGSKTCQDTEGLNPASCGCFFFLSLTVQLTSPTFTTIDADRVQQLESVLATQTSTQAFVASATFTPNGRLRLQTQYFGVDGRDLDFAAATAIVRNFTSQNIDLGAFVPYLVTQPPYPILPPAPSRGTSTHLGTGAIIGLVVAALVVGVIVAAVAFYALRQKKRADKAEGMSKPFASWPGGKDGDSGGAPKLKGARWFSYADLKRATSNFSDSNEIGVGGYGKVYKGKLETGEVVAIKRAQEGSMQGQTEFKNEIELLSRVHHRNLVGLVGFCYEQGEQMLVYEYMPNGTMRDHLIGKSDAPLDWRKRLSIALGSARGLAYLHELADPPIIHRDIKSSNILLDEKLIAKVADFGLSKLAPDGGGKTHISTQVKGTLGYLDPEYYMTQQLSDKSDVYSFGVVLLELLTARQPIERGKYIVREVKTALDRGGMPALRALLDPFLTDYSAHDLKSFLDLALRCVEEAAANRPTMTEVARELEMLAGTNSYPDSGHVGIGMSTDSASSYDQESLTRPR